MFNLRKALSTKKDEEQILIHSNAQYPVWEAESGHKRDGGVSTEVAESASQSAEIVTVAAAIMKGRIESGDENSHKRLQNSNVNVSVKRIDRGWGKWLSDRRRV